MLTYAHRSLVYAYGRYETPSAALLQMNLAERVTPAYADQVIRLYRPMRKKTFPHQLLLPGLDQYVVSRPYNSHRGFKTTLFSWVTNGEPKNRILMWSWPTVKTVPSDCLQHITESRIGRSYATFHLMRHEG